MKLYSNDIEMVESEKYQGYYDIKRDLIDKFLDCNIFACPTTLKGIGKSYSSWNSVIIPDIINQGLGAIIIKWGKGELDGMIDNFKKNNKELIDKLPFKVEWSKFKDITILRRADDGREVLIFTSPASFGTLKGYTIEGMLHEKLYNVYWDEFLTTRGIYIKPKQTLDSFWQMIGSIFRENDYRIIMTANMVDKNNPFLHYFFSNMGFPDKGYTIIDHTAGVVIDSPIQSEMITKKYKKSRLYMNSLINQDVHHQLFSKYDIDIYDDYSLIKMRVTEDVKYMLSLQVDNLIFNVVQYYDSETNSAKLYITPQNVPCDKMIYALDWKTTDKSGLDILPSETVNGIKRQIDKKNIYYRDPLTMNVIVENINRRFMILNYKNPDWTF